MGRQDGDGDVKGDDLVVRDVGGGEGDVDGVGTDMQDGANERIVGEGARNIGGSGGRIGRDRRPVGTVGRRAGADDRGGLGDGEVDAVRSAGVVGVAGEGVGGSGGAGRHVGGVVGIGGQRQAAGAGHADRAGGLGETVVDHRDRAGDRYRRGGRGDREGRAVASDGVVGVAEVDGAGAGGAGVGVGRVGRGQRAAEAVRGRVRGGAGGLGEARVDLVGDRAGDRYRRGGRGDREGRAVANDGVVGVAEVDGAGAGGAGVGVGLVGRGQRAAETVRGRVRGGAGGLGETRVDHRDRAGDRYR